MYKCASNFSGILYKTSFLKSLSEEMSEWLYVADI